MLDVAPVRTLVFYGDITGFSTWGRRVSRERVRDLISETYAIYGRWEHRYKYWVKKNADGMIAAGTLMMQNDRDKITRMLRAVDELSDEVNQYLRGLVYPRPGLFRIRGVLGDAWKFTDIDGSVDFAGDPMDFGRRLLDIAKHERIIISEGVFDGLGGKACRHIRLKEIKLGALNLIGVHPEEQQRFWTYTFKGKK